MVLNTNMFGLFICSDVRLVFQNAMKYNDENSDVHSMGKKLLDKFEEKWRQFLPRVTEEVNIYRWKLITLVTKTFEYLLEKWIK